MPKREHKHARDQAGHKHSYHLTSHLIAMDETRMYTHVVHNPDCSKRCCSAIESPYKRLRFSTSQKTAGLREPEKGFPKQLRLHAIDATSRYLGGYKQTSMYNS